MRIEVPEGWKSREIGSFSTRLKRNNESGEDLEPLSITKDQGVILQRLKYKKRIATDPHKYLIAHDGDFAFDPMSLYYGAVGRVNSIGRGLISPDYVVFSVDETINHDFLLYLLRAPAMHRIYDVLSETSNSFGKRRRLYWSVLSKLSLAIPPLPEQKKIVEVLSSVDEAIQATEAVIEQTRHMKEGLLQELLAKGIGHTQFKKTPKWVIGRLPEIKHVPKSWEVVSINDFAQLESGHTPSRKEPDYWNGEINWLSLHDTKHMEQHIVMKTNLTITTSGIENSSARILPEGTVALSRTATVGKCVILGQPMATSQDFACYICGEKLHNKYLMHLFRYMQHVWSSLSEGSTHQTIYMPVFKKLQILLPPKKEQEDIALLLDSIDYELSSLAAVVRSYQSVKEGLFRDLLSGQVRVSV